ncbi:MAG: hypothetical protein ACAH80_18555 [Alphaproteobacteria bacterium]
MNEKLHEFFAYLVSIFHGAKVSLATSFGVIASSAFFVDWREWVLFIIGLLIGLLRLYAEYLRVRRERIELAAVE